MRWFVRIFRRPDLLHVAVHGGSGPTVVLIHGIASSSVTFQNVLPLIRGDHECFAIDLLGFGASPAPADSEYRIEDHVDALDRTIRSLHLKGTFTLVGHSMGALIAARYAANFPRRIGRLVLVSPPIYLSPDALSRTVDRGVMDLYLRAYQYLRLNKDFTMRSALRIERLLPIPRALEINERTWTPFVKSLQNSIEHQTTISDLALVRVPVEIVYGSMDVFHSEAVLKIVSRMSGVTVHRVTAGDHLIGKRLARVVATAIG